MIQSNQLYRHYKGGIYRIVALALEESSGESVVVYESVSEPEKIWTRPLSVFTEEVVRPSGEKVSRFEYIGESVGK